MNVINNSQCPLCPFPKLLNKNKNIRGTISINNNIFTVGRGLACNHIINSHNASRQHCRFEFDGSNWYLRDTSVNGTKLNSQLLKGARSDVPLKDGDEIIIVSPEFSYTFHLPQTESELCDEELVRIAEEIENLSPLNCSTQPSISEIKPPDCKRRKIEERATQRSTNSEPDRVATTNLQTNHPEFPESFVIIDESENVGANVCIGDTDNVRIEEESSTAVAISSQKEPNAIKETEANEQNDKAAGPSNASSNSMNIVENEMQCTICTELFIKAVTLNCSHSFCNYCITQWKKTRSVCPICRANILNISPTIVLDNFIEKIIETASEDVKQHRKERITERELLTEERKTRLIVLRNNRIIELSSDDDGDNEGHNDILEHLYNGYYSTDDEDDEYDDGYSDNEGHNDSLEHLNNGYYSTDDEDDEYDDGYSDSHSSDSSVESDSDVRERHIYNGIPITYFGGLIARVLEQWLY